MFYADRPARLILLMERSEAFDSGHSDLFEGLLNSVPGAIAITYAGSIFHINHEFVQLFGYTAEQAIGHNLNDLILPDSCRSEVAGLSATLETEGRVSLETIRRARSGEEIDVSILVAPLTLATGVRGEFITFRDIRQQKLADARLQYSALHDPLTGLPNRALFLDRLRLTMARSDRRAEHSFAVMFLDLDQFKQINDSLGHEAGDALLKEVAQRLSACLRPEDTIARLGGDEFVLLLGDANTAPEAAPRISPHLAQIATRILVSLHAPVALGSTQTSISASIGIALSGSQYQRPEEIIRDADLAMYRAKAKGKHGYEFFDPSMAVMPQFPSLSGTTRPPLVHTPAAVKPDLVPASFVLRSGTVNPSVSPAALSQTLPQVLD